MNFPFAAVVGNSTAKLALLLLAVDRQLRGVLIASPSGSAKSVLARAAQALFQSPDSEAKAATPFVELPLGATADHLLGALDFARALRSGKKTFSQGLLAQANGGALYVDDINLLATDLVTHLAAALDARCLPAAGDGLKAATGADFVLIGSHNSEVGEVPALLRARVAMLVEGATLTAPYERAEIIRRVNAYHTDAARFSQRFAAEMQALHSAVRAAKGRLPKVQIALADLRRLSTLALRLAVEGHQADIFAVRVATANAALNGRCQVNDDDLRIATQLVLLPRATKLPAAFAADPPANQAPRPNDQDEAQPDQHKPEPGADELGNSASPTSREGEERQLSKTASNASLEEWLIEALDAYLPTAALQEPLASRLALKKTSSGKSTKRKSAASAPLHRGRVIRHSANPTAEKSLALTATLRAAAPLQMRRRARQPACEKALLIAAQDLRYKRHRQKTGVLYIFAVDASGSMAVNRMAQAKGAMTRLLQQSYIHRDQVAFICFRQGQAQVLLPPTRSVERAKQLVDALPTGGATPMAAALLKAKAVADAARSQTLTQVIVVLFTDGRANVAWQPQATSANQSTRQIIEAELRQLGALLQHAKIHLVVIDTKAKFLAGGEAKALAATLGAEYLYLPRADERTIDQALMRLANQHREGQG
ncbi:MAG: magnesium chelatase ATPase subunit D [Acidobacteria bacterium]|nr:magnesium chelatase ATPase subunit D [Acidobacteriota bacterium]